MMLVPLVLIVNTIKRLVVALWLDHYGSNISWSQPRRLLLTDETSGYPKEITPTILVTLITVPTRHVLSGFHSHIGIIIYTIILVGTVSWHPRIIPQAFHSVI